MLRLRQNCRQLGKDHDRQRAAGSTKTQKVIKGLLGQDQKEVQYCVNYILIKKKKRGPVQLEFSERS